MEKFSLKAAVHSIALQEGISDSAVLQAMQEAIDSGYNDPDPAVRAQWDAMPFTGKPTPEELIHYLLVQSIAETGRK